MYGILLKALVVSSPPFSKDMSGKASMLLTITIPVIAQITTVSQNVPVLDTRAWRTGFLVFAAAATIGAEPSPDSLLKSPLAIPYLAAIIIPAPTNPPPAASGLKAETTMSLIAGHTNSEFIHSMTIHPITGTKIKGFQIPFWKEAKEMVVEAAKLSSHVRYVGWDVGMSVNGPVLIEGNQFPGHDIYQVAEKIKDGDIGVLPMFEKAIYGDENKDK